MALDTLVIRNLEERDLERVRDLLASAPEVAAWPVEGLTAREGNLRVRVAEEDGTVGGVVIFRMVADEAEILNLVVEAVRRRRRMGSRLLNDVIAACADAGAQKIFLEVRDSNRAAREFYARLEFRETGRRQGYYRTPTEDALVLVLTV